MSVCQLPARGCAYCLALRHKPVCLCMLTIRRRPDVAMLAATAAGAVQTSSAEPMQLPASMRALANTYPESMPDPEEVSLSVRQAL